MFLFGKLWNNHSVCWRLTVRWFDVILFGGLCSFCSAYCYIHICFHWRQGISTQSFCDSSNGLHTWLLVSFPHRIINTKKLYKATIWRNTSWKAGNGQLGKFYFPVGKIFFLSWKIIFFQLGTFRSPFWRVFVRFWPLMAIICKHQKCFTFSFLFRQKKHFERWAMRG